MAAEFLESDLLYDHKDCLHSAVVRETLRDILKERPNHDDRHCNAVFERFQSHITGFSAMELGRVK